MPNLNYSKEKTKLEMSCCHSTCPVRLKATASELADHSSYVQHRPPISLPPSTLMLSFATASLSSTTSPSSLPTRADNCLPYSNSFSLTAKVSAVCLLSVTLLSRLESFSVSRRDTSLVLFLLATFSFLRAINTSKLPARAAFSMARSVLRGTLLLKALHELAGLIAVIFLPNEVQVSRVKCLSTQLPLQLSDLLVSSFPGS